MKKSFLIVSLSLVLFGLIFGAVGLVIMNFDFNSLATEKEIDEINILNATFLAMRRAVEAMGEKPDLVLVDGNRKPVTGYEEITVVKGDAKSISIAAASILAKVSRDRYMKELAERHPEYKFEQHKGYGTKLHYEMIEQYGILPDHRRSFLKKILEK